MADAKANSGESVVIPSWVAVLILTAFGAALYVPALNWGLPATVSWSQDTIAGMRTIGAVDGWPAKWQGRYPPLHYLILRGVYQPVLMHWENSGQLSQDAQSGQMDLAPPHVPKFGVLFFLAGVVSAVMGVGAGMGVWMFARELTGNSAVGLAAAVAMMVGADFTYFAHLGCVDVPSVFWLAWSLFFYARCLRTRSLPDAALLGLFGALAISTKDSVAGVFPGMAVVLLIHEYRCTDAAAPFARRLLLAILQPRWIVGIVLFALPYLTICGAFPNWDGYAARMRYWLGLVPTSLHARQQQYDSQLALLGASLRYAAGAVGWPMLGAMLAATGFALVRRRRIAAVILLPAISYYLTIIVPTNFVYARFLFPIFALIAVLVGDACMTLWAHRSRRVAATMLSLVVLLPSLGYALAVDAEMSTDSRYDAEAWFLANVPIETTVGGIFSAAQPRPTPQYLPRMHDFGYSTYPVILAAGVFDHPQPEFLVLSSFDLEDFGAEEKQFAEKLLAGQWRYEVVARFDNQFLGTGQSILGIAGWGAPVTGKISPTVWVMRVQK